MKPHLGLSVAIAAAMLLAGVAQALPLAGQQRSGVLIDRVEARRYCWRTDGPSGPARRCRAIGDDYYRRWLDGSEESRGGRRNIHGRHWRGTNEKVRPAAARRFQDGARGDASPERANVPGGDRSPLDRGAVGSDRPGGSINDPPGRASRSAR